MQNLIRDNNSYDAFKKAVSTAFPTFINAAAAPSDVFQVNNEQEKRAQIFDKMVGLVFVGVSSGRLFVERIIFDPTWFHESNMPGHEGQLSYASADWNEIGQQPATLLFHEGLRVHQADLEWALEQPDNLLHGALELMEKEASWFTGPPNFYLKVSTGKPVPGRRYSKRELRDLVNSSVIEPLSRGGYLNSEIAALH